ncbi:hypothetical protein [Scytonema millei]|uniref:Uncharacterized protein n=1 Tax=Scytonema millei VB511283 TaxID=1245923 RepID=A0A9X5E7D8_9CYAN|nr:hypothetical protein [Scytonema millei]NHC36489.1 hypothetical protein [Scytonema millei VB511283]
MSENREQGAGIRELGERSGAEGERATVFTQCCAASTVNRQLSTNNYQLPTTTHSPSRVMK